MSIRAVNKRGWYEVGDQEYISVTTVLSIISKGDGLLNWYAKLGFEKAKEVMKEKGKRGTTVHKTIEQYLRGNIKNFDLQPKEIKTFCEPVAKWVNDMGLDIMDIERIVYSDKSRFAGSLDILAKLPDGKIIIGDFKTSKAIYNTYFLQLAAYAKALQEKDKIKVDSLVIIRPDEDGELEIQSMDNIDELYEIFLSALKIYKWLHPRNALRLK